MHQTNIERLKKAMSNIHEKKTFIVNEDNEWKKEAQQKKEESYKKMDAIFDYLNEMYTCKKCNKNCRLFGKKLDDKVILKTGMCFDCLVQYETELRITGEYNEYAQKKIEDNAKSWLEEFKQTLEDYKNQYSDEVKSYVTEAGDVEEWGGGIEKEKFCDLLDNLYKNVERQIFGDESSDKDEKKD